jgi:hypothetical protein
MLTAQSSSTQGSGSGDYPLITSSKIIIQEKEMKISQTYGANSGPQARYSARPGLMLLFGSTLLSSALAIAAIGSATAGEAQARVATARNFGPETQPAADGSTQAAPPLSGVIGKVQSFTGSSLDVQTPSGVVHVEVKQPLTTYKQIPSDLTHVTSASYVGVASTEQADGKEVAKQIIIFPAELSGAAEGSVLTDPPSATTHSRMTNGSVSRPAVSHSRMTNGTVEKGGGTTLVVRYQDGSKTISVPANVPVTEVAPENVTFADGDVVYAATEKRPNGTLVTDKIFLFIPAASPDTRR